MRLPKDFNDSYNEAMNRIESQNDEDRIIAHSTLTWVVNAKQPLKAQEILVALAVEPGTRELDNDNLLDIEIILSVCAGLVILDEQSDVVRLVHYTTQEYFDSIQQSKFPDAQTDITSTLLTFLAFDEFVGQSWERLDDLPPLLDYAQYCLVHAVGRPETQLRDDILEFISHAGRWKHAMRWKWESPPWDFSDWPSRPSALWIAAAANLLELAKCLLGDTPFPQLLCTTEIIVAAYYAHKDIVQLLLDHGADVNVQSEKLGRAIQPTAFERNKEIVQLLKHGTDLNVLSRNLISAVQAGAFGGPEDIVHLMLNHSADIDTQRCHHGSAIQAAARLGHEPTVQLLIAHGADVNAPGGCYGRAIQVAAREGHENIVQLLISNGANVNVSGGDGGSALQIALSNGYQSIAQLLRKNGAKERE